MQVTIDPIIFYIGSFGFRWYNLILIVSLAIAGVFLLLEARRLGLPRIHAVRIYLWSLLFVAVFAKLFLFWDKWDYFSADPALMLSLSGARLDGAIAGFLLLLVIYWRVTGYSFWLLADVVTLDMAVAIAIGRWACFFNGCCYGLPCDLPWAVIYAHPHSRAPLDMPLHPVQLYQVIWYSATFVLLWLIRKDLKPAGSLLLLFIIMHALGDFITRIYRDDNEFFLGLQQAQVFSVVMLAAAIPIYLKRRKNYERDAVLAAAD